MASLKDYTQEEVKDIADLHLRHLDLIEKYKAGEYTTRQFKYRMKKINNEIEEIKTLHELRIGIDSLAYAYKTGAISTKDYLKWKEKYLNYIDEVMKR